MRNRAKLNLRLNLSPPRRDPAEAVEMVARVVGSPRESSEDASSASSCLSTEVNEEVSSSTSPVKSPAAMVVAGCSRCLMYVMVLENDLRCPRCRNNVLLDLLCNQKKKP
ncbi:PREDICTED: uncharacterized protein LOC104824456 [Tarenaya hassleriana]|uniref:uncharacterized protein LOC104824456 n=1 Tax=Tarenaya hassleriana TaxID=28532 RepID=UPI00053C917E|nr:PREDICTED: uncharacterized protein LOC104824456 [Tarenaya hassleriana]